SLSVRELVEWVIREGDIDNRYAGPAREDAMLLGANAHRRLQKAAGGDYRAEVPVSYTAELLLDGKEPFFLTVDGRADGVIEGTGEDGMPALTVDEIKGVFRDVQAMEGPEKVHLAQAEMYAFILADERGQCPVSVQMTYVELHEDETNGIVTPLLEQVRRFTFRYSYEEIRTRFYELIDLYEPWIRFMVRHERERNASAKDLPFPYEYRPGQKTIVRQVYESVTAKKHLFVQAPTGIGKTLAMLYPVIRASSEGKGDKIFYLTAKTVAGRAAEEAIRILSEKGLCFSCIQITAKEKLCPLDKAECDPVHCDRAKGHFSRVNEAIYDLITHERSVSMAAIQSYAEKYRVCPYEFALDVSLFMDVIICDYNYVFDPHVYFRRYFAGGESDSVLLIDEAHNLVERAREMYSAVLVKEEVLAGKKLFADGKTVVKHLTKLNTLLLNEKRLTEHTRELSDTDLVPLYAEATALADSMSRYFDRHRSTADRDEKLDLYFRISDFVTTYESMGAGYLSYAGFAEDGGFFVKLFCIDPSERLSERLGEIRSAVFFSATFLPIRYYKELLSGNADSEAIYIDSPFDPDRRRILISRDVSSKYTRRNAAEYERIAAYLLHLAETETGNYLAFFPSHKFLEDVAEVLEKQAGDRIEIIRQQRVMREEERSAFLSQFTEDGRSRERSLLGLSVMGGLFSEGIDLKGDSLIGVAVVGTGLPQVSGERELIRTYYERNGQNGFDYAYRFPGFTKVLQAAGRLIRTVDDEGIILLLDERFLFRDNLALFPREWAEFDVIGLSEATEKIRNFWRWR
ncbi:MAG: ATP-dependent DNA helicase, partial [Lachnospiraceae bacterium]|nr:ATP-dependent DNA helicase [Lachnospiraceae bacterium]